MLASFLTRRHRLSLLLLLGLVSDPYEHLEKRRINIRRAHSKSAGCRRKELRFLYLLPGVEDHDIIGGEIVLGQLPRNLLDLEGREGI